MNPKVPAPEAELNHQIDIQIRFGDVDMFGHVNNAAYVSMLDCAKIRFFQDIIGPELTPEKIGLVVVNINCSFYSPTYLNEPLKAATGVVAVGEHSVRLEQRIFNPSTGDVKCVCHNVLAGFDPSTATSAPIAPTLRQKLVP